MDVVLFEKRNPLLRFLHGMNVELMQYNEVKREKVLENRNDSIVELNTRSIRFIESLLRN